MSAFNAIIGYPLGWIMYFCYEFVNNYGIALIMFTILTRLLMVPMAINQQKSMAKMASFRPKMEELQKKYGNNKERLNEEMVALYQKENYNPMSGCLPLLIQFPILFGLIDVIYYPLKHIIRLPKEVIAEAVAISTNVLGAGGMNRYSTEMSVISAMQQDPSAFAHLGTDVVNKISAFDFTFFGLDLGVVPTVALNMFILVPILSGITSLLMSMVTMRTSSATMGQNDTAASMNKSMMLMMPLMSIMIAFQVPTGVGMYWVLTNTFMVVQQLILGKIFNPKEMMEKAKAEEAERKVTEREEKIEAKKRAKDGDVEAKEKSLSQKEINRIKLAAARKRDAEKYGEEYIEDEDDIK